MAERRMFAKTIIDSDAFLDMPVTARLLYYDLGMRADDDGFVNSPKKIMRITGASSDDMNILIMRKFIIPFDSGVVAIKHWRIHNYIRKDTYVETKYKDEKEQLMLDENNAYTAKKMQLLQLCDEYVDEPSTQVRLGKDRLGKDREEEEKEDPPSSSDILKMYGDNIHPVSSPVEAEKLKALVDTHGETFVTKAIERTVMRNKRSLAYITGILNNWEANGYDEGIEGKRTEKQSDPGRSADLERFMREREEHKKKQRRF